MAETTKIKVSHDGIVSLNLRGDNGTRIAKKIVTIFDSQKSKSEKEDHQIKQS